MCLGVPGKIVEIQQDAQVRTIPEDLAHGRVERVGLGNGHRLDAGADHAVPQGQLVACRRDPARATRRKKPDS